MRAPWALALGVCALALCAQSCGYTTGLKVLEKHASVGLEIFGNALNRLPQHADGAGS